jgi:hypothetical protein
MKRLGDLAPGEGIELAKAKIDTGIEVFDFVLTVGRGTRGDWQAFGSCSHNGVRQFKTRSPTASTYAELEPSVTHMMAQLAEKYGCEWEICGVEMEPFSSRWRVHS